MPRKIVSILVLMAVFVSPGFLSAFAVCAKEVREVCSLSEEDCAHKDFCPHKNGNPHEGHHSGHGAAGHGHDSKDADGHAFIGCAGHSEDASPVVQFDEAPVIVSFASALAIAFETGFNPAQFAFLKDTSPGNILAPPESV